MTDRDRRASVTATTGSPSSSDRRAESDTVDLLVIGGGAAGFMAAITAAEQGVRQVRVLEATAEPLSKVRMSGGGRCNVTHACWDPRELVGHYPRGQRPLRGPFSRFASGDAVAWFAERGLALVEEADGRMFPEANRSSAVVSCLRQAARDHSVALSTGAFVTSLKHDRTNGFLAECRGGELIRANRVLLATGGHPSGRRLASGLGHRVIAPVPSLFTLALDAPQLVGCAGIALDDVVLDLEVGEARFRQVGRVLITHWGLSGPATLRLTAFAARVLRSSRFRATLKVCWAGSVSQEQLLVELRQQRIQSARRMLAASRPLAERLPRRLWLAMLHSAGVPRDQRWSDLPARLEQRLLQQLHRCRYAVKGRGPFGEEFVTAGGVDLGEIDLARMESRCCPGLHVAGELLDVDGVTGGFNFQHCWTSGWLAGQAAALALIESDQTR